jgi:hypothetical protein
MLLFFVQCRIPFVPRNRHALIYVEGRTAHAKNPFYYVSFFMLIMELSIFPINANMILGFLSFSSLDGTTELKYNHSPMLASYSFNSSIFDFFFRVWNLYTL